MDGSVWTLEWRRGASFACAEQQTAFFSFVEEFALCAAQPN
jgi:hypothetical protein